MSGELNLTLPARKQEPGGGSKAVLLLLLLVLVVVVTHLVFSLRGGPQERVEGGLSADAQKELALKLEKQKLDGPAARAWKEYLDAANAGPDESAKVWYRIGKLYQEAGRHEEALESYYRSESFAKVGELAPEIARRTQECLEALGKFAALRYELAERVGVGQAKSAGAEEIVAEIGPQKITKADLDGMIEEEIGRQLSQFASYLPPQERNNQKEAMLRRFSSPSERLRMLNQFVMEELLYRKARESKLAENPEMQADLRNIEKRFLAQKALEAELADKIKITRGDLETYYEAHKRDYVRPERAQISHILLKDEKSANEVLDSLKAGAKFEELARKLSQDEQTKEAGGQINGWVEKGSHIPGIGYSDEATAAIFSTDAGKVSDKIVETSKGFHVIEVRAREPERQKTFEEVRPEVFRALRMRKETEVQEALLEELKERYHVVVHQSKFVTKQQAQSEAGKEQKKK